MTESRLDTPYPLPSLLASQALARLIIHFILYPNTPLHFRALERRTRLGRRSLANELARLEDAGLIERRSEGRRVLFQAKDHPGWLAFLRMVREFADPAEVLRVALAGLEGVDAAFVFGSYARGDTHEESDVDLFLVGEVDWSALCTGTSEASAALGREVEIVHYGRKELGEKLSSGRSFVRRVLDGPKRWIVPDTYGILRIAV